MDYTDPRDLSHDGTVIILGKITPLEDLNTCRCVTKRLLESTSSRFAAETRMKGDTGIARVLLKRAVPITLMPFVSI